MGSAYTSEASPFSGVLQVEKDVFPGLMMPDENSDFWMWGRASFNASRVVPTAAENRPVNVSPVSYTHLRLELDDVYFEWGREAVGWARGSWKGLYDPETGMVRLPDETYRLLLKAKIGANRWDGTVPGAYEVWESAFADTGSLILMPDNQDMSVVIGLAGAPLDAVMRNLLLLSLIHISSTWSFPRSTRTP